MTQANQETKQCPLCSNELPLAEFGLCRARKDGRNLYCKSCIRKKVTESRNALKAYRLARKRYLTQKEMLERSLTDARKYLAEAADVKKYVVEAEEILSKGPKGVSSASSGPSRVKEALRKGARTQGEISEETRLSTDEVQDALAHLLLWTREIRTEVVDRTRMYFLNQVELDQLLGRSDEIQTEAERANQQIIEDEKEIRDLKTHTREMLRVLSEAESSAA